MKNVSGMLKEHYDVLVINGYGGCGKSMAAQYLSKKMKIPYFDVSSIILKYGPGPKMKGKAVVLNDIDDLIKQNIGTGVILTGFRELYLLQHLESKYNVFILWLTCKTAIRWVRLKESKKFTTHQSKIRDIDDRYIGIEELVDYGDIILSNNLSKEELYPFLDVVAKQLSL